MVRLLIAALLPIALLAGCGTAPSTLAVVQAQAAAAIADLQTIGPCSQPEAPSIRRPNCG